MRGYEMPVTHRGQTRTVRSNDLSLYERVLIAPDGRQWLLGYGKRTQHALIKAMQSRGHQIMELMGNPDDSVKVTYGKTPCFEVRFSNGWTVTYSGRTEREAITEGERTLV